MPSALNFNKEKRLFVDGFQKIAGIDEAGRGSWAGPVVAACLVFDEKKALGQAEMNAIVADSKLLSPAKREKIFYWLVENFNYGVGVVDSKFIDDNGIIRATKLAMKLAVKNLPASLDYLLIDAVDLNEELSINQENIIRADRLIWTVAAASIIAKVSRDKLMERCHIEYPAYCFDKHKGYGTELHRKMIEAHGICPLHRRSYRPVLKLSAG